MRDARHPLDRLEHRRRADAAVERRRRRRRALELRARTLPAPRRRAVLPSSSVVICATIGRSQTRADGADRGADLVDVAEGLEDEQVDAAFDERARLLARSTPRASSTPVLPQGSMRMPSGPIAPATQAWSRAACRAIRAPCRLIAVHLRRRGRTPPSLTRLAPNVFVSMTSAPRAHVGLVDLGDEIGLRQVQLVERAVEEDAARVQHRPHRAVADEHALVELLEE